MNPFKYVRIDSDTVIQVDSNISDDVAYHEYWDKLEGSRKALELRDKLRKAEEKKLEEEIEESLKEFR